MDARGRAYRVPQQRLLAASVADLDYALAGMQPLPSLQVPATMHACNLFTTRVCSTKTFYLDLAD